MRLTERGTGHCAERSRRAHLAAHRRLQHLPRPPFLPGRRRLATRLLARLAGSRRRRRRRSSAPNRSKPIAKQLTIDKVAIRGGDVFINPRVELRVPLSGIWEGGALSRHGQCLGRAEELRPLRAPLRRGRRHSHRNAHWPHRVRLWHQLDSSALGRPRQLPLLDWALLKRWATARALARPARSRGRKRPKSIADPPRCHVTRRNGTVLA